MRRIPVDQTQLTQMLGLEVKPNLDRDGSQRQNLDGLNLWSVSCLIKESETSSFETLDVKVASPSAPRIQTMQPVNFSGLTASFWEMSGRTGTSFSAKSVVVEAAGKVA